MPTYEYVCKNCGERLEVQQSFTDESLRACPNCGGELKKVFGSVGIVFKGSGFYKTDSRGTSAAVSGASHGETKSDSSPSTGAESSAPASGSTPSSAPASTPAPATPSTPN